MYRNSMFGYPVIAYHALQAAPLSVVSKPRGIFHWHPTGLCEMLFDFPSCLKPKSAKPVVQRGNSKQATPWSAAAFPTTADMITNRSGNSELVPIMSNALCYLVSIQRLRPQLHLLPNAALMP